MIDVRDYGAVGDGVTDDRAAIQAALDIGGWVYVPPGVYAIASGPLRIYSHTRLTLDPQATILRAYGGGMLINGDAAQNYGGYGGHGHILIEGGTWDVNATAAIPPGGGLGFGHCEDITIRDVTILNVPDTHALEINSARTVLIDNCTFKGFVDASGTRGFSEAIQIDAAISTGTFGGFGPYDQTVCDGVEVRSCRFGGSGTPGTRAWPRGVGTHTAPTTRHRNIKVTDCIFDGVDTAVRAYWWDSVIVEKNQVQAAAGDAIAVQYNTRYAEVINNEVMDAARNGIYISDDCSQINIRGNDIIGSGTAANATYGGIHAVGSSYLRITGNTVRKRASGNAAKYGLWIESTCSNIHRYGNTLQYSGATGSLSDASPSPVTSANDAL
ncbi:MAG: hypothetical protein JWO67_7203 [Streptosporangiaceae bacterium]|nr:hypothetical protein [Streptosporangiaceae bacterium]